VAEVVDKLIGALAATQRGYVARWQLLELGLTNHAIQWRLDTGRLIRVYPGVYAVGHIRTAPIDRASAAVLACGPGAVLSHFTAAALWGWVNDWDAPFEVSVPGDRRPKGIRVHRSRPLARRDTTRHKGIPVTTPALTALDCAATTAPHRLPRLINEAFISTYLKEAALDDALGRHPTHPGAKRLLPYADEGHGRTRSDLEDKFVAFIERFDLPMPELNFPLNGRVLDAFYTDEGVIVEIDSHRFHGTREAFELDREKDSAAMATGLATMRLTDRMMERNGEREARNLQTILARRRRQAA
jgi:hypothetical protein